MSQRSANRLAMQSKLEVTYGVEPGSWASSDFVLTGKADLTPETGFEQRDLALPYFGVAEELAAVHLYRAKFPVEMAGSGTVDLAPAWAKNLLVCGFAATTFAASRVEMTPVSEGEASLTHRIFDDGVRRILRGVRGTAMIDIPAFKIPKIEFDHLGMDTIHSEAATPAQDYAAYQRPVVVTDAATGDITVGGTYATGTITGGTKLQSLGLSINLGVTVEHFPVLGGEAVVITGREITGKVTVALTTAEEVALWTAIRGNSAIASLGVSWGTTAGHRFTIFGERVQRSKPKPVDVKGRRFFETELRFLPSFTGLANRELIIASR